MGLNHRPADYETKEADFYKGLILGLFPRFLVKSPK